MGCNLCRKKGYQKVNYLAPDEKEINFKDYTSPNDEPLSIIESKENFFNFVQLVEFVNLLEQFDIETSGVITDEPMHSNFSSKDEFLFKSLTLEEFQSFIENKILILEDISNSIKKEDIKIFNQFCNEMYQTLESKLKEHYNNNENSFKLIKKRNILAFGILFCGFLQKLHLLYK